MSIAIIRLLPDDWERHRAIRLQALRTAPEMYSTQLADMVEQPEPFWCDIMARNRYFYGLLGDDVVGLAGLATPSGKAEGSPDKETPFTEALPAGAGMLISVFVSARARGLGLGRQLSVAVIQQARAEGLNELVLDVAEHNVVAQGLYKKLGFALTGERRPSGRRELEMRLKLVG
jgi:ribosomal protein S18 acetylase RimI-like enzyme